MTERRQALAQGRGAAKRYGKLIVERFKEALSLQPGQGKESGEEEKGRSVYGRSAKPA